MLYLSLYFFILNLGMTDSPYIDSNEAYKNICKRTNFEVANDSVPLITLNKLNDDRMNTDNQNEYYN